MFQYLPMVTVALLLGGECTGKTALADGLAQEIRERDPELTVAVVSEVLREFVARRGRPPTRDEQVGIWRTQTRLLGEAIAASSTDGLVICDPAPIMTAVYSLQYFDDDSLLAPALTGMALTENQTRDLVVWCAPDIPWQSDGIQRDGPEARERTHELIGTHVVPALERIPLTVASGDVRERVAQVLHHLA